MIACIDVGGGLVGLKDTRYDQALVDASKKIPGMRWNPGARAWIGYPDAVREVCTLLGLPVGSNCRLKPFAGEGADKGAGAVAGLRQYQKTGVAFLSSVGRCILADDMGMGKSIQAIAAACAVGGKVVIVCPNFVKSVWFYALQPKKVRKSKKKVGVANGANNGAVASVANAGGGSTFGGELLKWWPGLAPETVYLPKGTGAKLLSGGIPGESQVVVINYDIVEKWAPAIIEWVSGSSFSLVLDEAHLVGNAKSGRSRGVRTLADASTRLWALSGTPMTNRPKDLFNLLDTLYPGRLGSFYQYGVRYCGGHQVQVTPEKLVWDFSGASNLEELRRRLEFIMLRRTKAEVTLELPPKTRQIIRVPASATNKKPNDFVEVSDIEVDVEVDMDDVVGAYGRAFGPVGGSNAVTLGGGGEGADGVSMGNKKEARRQLALAAEVKFPTVLDMVKEHTDAGHKVIVASYRRKVADDMVAQLTRRGVTASVIHGGIAGEMRLDILLKYRALEGAGVIAVTIDTCSTGIDLSFADVLVVAELTYEPHELLQLESRIHRSGQMKNSLIQYVVADGSLDDFVVDIVLSKLDTFDQTIGAADNLSEGLRGTEEDILSSLYAAIGGL